MTKNSFVSYGIVIGLVGTVGLFFYSSADHRERVSQRVRFAESVAQSPVVRACGNGMVLRDVSGRLYLDAGPRSGWASAGMSADEVCKG